MKSSPIPDNELARLKALHRYHILDTEPEENFDELTELAAIICNTPVATITLIDEKREWYKSKVGVTDEEAARDISFCAHTILLDDILIVPDTLEDERFFDNPFVLEDPPLRFYAGVSLQTPGGHHIGTLCVIDHIPRTLDETQQQALKTLANQVVMQLELRKNLTQLKDMKKLAETSLVLSNRALRVLSLSNHAIICIVEEKKLLEKICEIIVEDGGYRFAWIGYAEHDECKTVRNVASYGYEEGYLDMVTITWADNQYGHGPAGTAIRTGKLSLTRNVLKDRKFSPWKKAASKRGYATVLGLPLKISTKGEKGVLMIYAPEVSAFDTEEVKLLSDLADNLSNGINSLRRETERKQTDDQIRQSREQLRNLASSLHAAREEERAVIARDIHDELGQSLTGLKMDLSWMLVRLPRHWKKLPERMQSMISLVDSTVDYVRELSAQLRPAILDDLGLEAAIEWELEVFAKRTNCAYTLDLKNVEINYDRDRDTTIFRIFQEALTNVARHAKATEVEIVLQTSNSQLILKVKDDGVGIAKDKIMSTDSIGLFGMHERANAFGGKVQIEAMKEGGTMMTLAMPLAAH